MKRARSALAFADLVKVLQTEGRQLLVGAGRDAAARYPTARSREARPPPWRCWARLTWSGCESACLSCMSALVERHADEAEHHATALPHQAPWMVDWGAVRCKNNLLIYQHSLVYLTPETSTICFSELQTDASVLEDHLNFQRVCLLISSSHAWGGKELLLPCAS